MAEYGVSLLSGPHDYNNTKHIGWQENLGNKNTYNLLYTQQNVNTISKAITTYLWPLKNTAIVVPDNEIRSMITSVWNAEKGADNADIYTQSTFDIARNPFKRI